MPSLSIETEERYKRYFREGRDSIEQDLRELFDDQELTEQVAQHHFQKDYDRVIYSTAFRKLGGTTQVVTPGEGSVIHNRLTHSLKVAQTSRLIYDTLMRQAARSAGLRECIAKFGGINRDTLQTACLAHDLGHPPFGHIGESALQAILAHPERIAGYSSQENARLCFEGNAQSFRIVTKLAFREPSNKTSDAALNLTRAALSAQSKYPWTEGDARADSGKWGAYESEATLLHWAMQGIRTRRSKVRGRVTKEARSIEAQIMDWADDVAYAVHDAEDFFRAGLVPFAALREKSKELDGFLDYAFDRIGGKLPPKTGRAAIEDSFKDGLLLSPTTTYIGSRLDRLMVRRFASRIIDDATQKIAINDQGVLVPNDEVFVLVETLKQLTWYYVIDRPSLSAAQRGQQTIVTGLVATLWTWTHDMWGQLLGTPEKATGRTATVASSDDAPAVIASEHTRKRRYRELPPRLVDFCDIAISEETTTEGTLQRALLRGVVDYVASLTDNEALNLHARLNGGQGQSMLYVGAST